MTDAVRVDPADSPTLPAEGREQAPRSPVWPPPLSAVFGAGAVLWGLLIGAQQLSDNSFFTHLATGRLILEDGIPTSDPYSFTAEGTSWVVQSWLASILFAGSERLLGTIGPHVVVMALTAMLGALVWLLTRDAGSLIPRVAITALALGVGSGLWTERPTLIGLIGLCLVLLAADGRFDPRWLLPVMWIWVNSHGSFPYAVVAVGALALGRRLDHDDFAVERRVLLWVVGGIALGAIGPLGPKVLLFPLNFLSNAEIFGYIVEWQSPSFTTAWSRIFLLQLLIGAVVLARRPSYHVAVPYGVFLVAALLAARNVAAASLVMVPGMAIGLAGMGSLRGEKRSAKAAIGVVAMALVGVMVVIVAGRSETFDLEPFPTVAVAWSEQNGFAPADRRIATQDVVGNWLEGRLGPDANVFVDDRYDMYPDQVAEDYLAVLGADPEWRERFERYDVDTLLWPSDSPLALLVASDDEWRVLLVADGWMVACLRGSPDC